MATVVETEARQSNMWEHVIDDWIDQKASGWRNYYRLRFANYMQLETP
jgi:hypothetical protein